MELERNPRKCLRSRAALQELHYSPQIEDPDLGERMSGSIRSCLSEGAQKVAFSLPSSPSYLHTIHKEETVSKGLVHCMTYVVKCNLVQVVLVGSDIPSLDEHAINRAFAALDTAEVIIFLLPVGK